jgi:Rrf2 family nitric oxide-sensitive transcriptional repressor
MKLTSHTDFGLRILLTLAVIPDRLVTIEELADRHRLSKNHLMKVAQSLIHAGFVEGVRGRNGGLRLLKSSSDIRIGDVVRRLEEDMAIVPCVSEHEEASCVLAGACGLTAAMRRALRAFLAELDSVTLADLTKSRQRIIAQLRAA